MIKKEIIWYKPSEKLPEVEIRSGRDFYVGLLLFYDPCTYKIGIHCDAETDKEKKWLGMNNEGGWEGYLTDPDYWSYLKDSYPGTVPC